MNASSYQIERLLRRLQAWLGGPERGASVAPERVVLTPEARAQAQPGEEPAGPAPGPEEAPVSPADLADRRAHPPVVEEELERRAGTFMEPPYPETPPGSRVPKLARERSPREPARPVTQGD